MFEVKLVINSPPRVQKNNLHIRKSISKTGRIKRWVGHSDNFKDYRNNAAYEMYKQYTNQGYSNIIKFLVAIDFVFYIKDLSADVDNLIAAPLDALMGVKVKGAKGLKTFQILEDDNLVKKLTAEKITEGDGYDGKPRTELTIREYAKSERFTNSRVHKNRVKE